MPEAASAKEPDEEWCAQHGLLDPDTCSDVAKHCNDTKQAAKTVQEGLLAAVVVLRITHPAPNTAPVAL